MKSFVKRDMPQARGVRPGDRSPAQAATGVAGPAGRVRTPCRRPASCEVGAFNGRVRPGDTVGAGPAGLAAIATGRLSAPERIIAVNPAPDRLEAAGRLGTRAVADARAAPRHRADDLADGPGADAATGAVGVPAARAPWNCDEVAVRAA